MTNLQLSPHLAAEALLQRRRIRTDLEAWCTEVLRPLGFKPAAHHRLLIHKLQALANGTAPKRKLMVLMPPGSAKSTYASDLFPAWFLAQRPNLSVIAASNTADLAGAFSRRVRGRIREHSKLLGVGLGREAEELWGTTNGGQYRSAGVGASIAGFRADLGAIDDPVKSREDADSERGQQRVWDWYWSDFMTRLKPGAAQVLVMTRWAEGDLGGRLEEAEGAEWEIIRLPAIAEERDPLGRKPGELLWSDDDYGFGAKLKDDFRSLTNAGRARDWSALYQQRPAPETGDYFRREWLRPVETLPPRETMRVYGASDYAVTSEGGDYTVHVVAGMDSTGRLWLLDLWRQQASADIWVDAFADLVLQWKPIGWAEETGQIRAGVGPFLDMRSRQRRAFVARTPFPTRGGDKGVRAQSIRGRIALDGLYYQKDAPWRMPMEAELMSFPAGKHDDIVDALGLLGQLLDRMTVGPAAKAKAPVKDSWQAAFERANGNDAEGDWKSA
jgi:predicted phage terminase large subunit-like protein